jgi:hypothetical protein
MSGAESLAIFGIACNVMQVISFAHDSITFFKQLHDERCADPSLRKAADQMRDATKSLVDSINVNCGHATLTAEEAELLKLANECMSGTTGTTTGAQKTVKASLWRTARLGGRTWWKKGEIERLEKDLNRAQKMMETRILIRIWYV